MKPSGEKRWSFLILVAVIIVSLGLYLANMSPRVVGTYHDDGIYVVTAKALATGQGYKIISLPEPLPQTKYPILYPFMLSLIWRVYPDFPGNLLPMKLLSVLSALLFVLFSYRYLTRFGYATWKLALAITALTALSPWVVWLSGMILTEMPYAFLSVLVLYLVESAEQSVNTGRNRRAMLLFLAGAIVAGMTYLMRSIALALIFAVSAYLACKRRWKHAALFFAVAVTLAIPWMVWAKLNFDNGVHHRDRVRFESEVYYTSYTAWFSEHTNGYAPATVATVFIKNLVYAAAGATSFLVPHVVFAPLPLMGIKIDSATAGLAVLSALGILAVALALWIRRRGYVFRLMDVYVAIYLLLVLVWPWPPTRFIVPLAPFIILYFLRMANGIFNLVFELAWQRRSSKPYPVRSALGAFIAACFIFNLVLDLVMVRQTLAWGFHLPPPVASPGSTWADTQFIFRKLMEATPKEAIIGTVHDPMYYLYTGRKAIRSFVVDPIEAFYAPEHSAASISSADKVVEIIRAFRINYLIHIPRIEPLMTGRLQAIKLRYPGLLRPLYNTPDLEVLIFEINLSAAP